MTHVDLRYPSLANTRWKSMRLGSLYPWTGGGGGGGGGNVNDPTSTAGSLAVGKASYAVPSSNVIYVSPSGSNNNPGTDEAAPKATLAAAVSAAATSGTTIVMRAGSYNEGGDTQSSFARNPGIFQSKQYTIQNYPGEAVWFDGSVPFTGAWTQSGSTWTHPYTMRFDRSHRTGSGADDVDSGSGTFGGGKYVDDTLNPCASWADMILVDRGDGAGLVQLTQVSTLAAVGPGKFFVNGSYTGTAVAPSTTLYWFQASSVVIGENPANLVEVRYSNKTSFLQTNTAGCTFRGFGIRRYATYMPGFGALYIQGGNTTLENLWFEDISTLATYTTLGSNIVHRNITARRIGWNYDAGSHCDGVLFDKLDLQQINSRNFSPAGPQCAIIKLSGVQGYTVQNSILSNSNCNGVWNDQTCDSVYVLNSRLQNLGQHAIDLEGASNWIVANCLVTNSGAYGVWNNDSDTGRMWNTTIVDSHRTVNGGSPFCIGQSKRIPSDASYSWMKDTRQPDSYYTVQSHQWHIFNFEGCNNVIAQSDGGKAQGLFSCQTQPDSSPLGTRTFDQLAITLKSNVYWSQSQTQYGFIYTKGYNVNAETKPTLAQAVAAHPSIEAGSSQPSTKPVNTTFQVTNSAFHTSAQPLPADIAALIGQTAGTKRAGAFLVGDPA